jgi:hypothetical protein
MPEQPTPTVPNQYYQAPLEVPSYVPTGSSPIPSQPIDLYGLFSLNIENRKKLATKAKSPYELMMEGNDPFASGIPDVSPLQTNMATIAPLDDPAGLFHSQDGFGKYGYSSILGGGDNEARYADNFRTDNPSLFSQPGLHPIDAVKKAFYWGGGFIEKTLESAVVKTGQGLGAIFGLTLGNAARTIVGENVGSFDKWLAASADNVLSNVFNSWDENLKQRYHYFQEKNERENKGFIQSLGDGDFWMNDVSDGLGFLVSSMFEAGLVGKLGLGTKVASRLAPLAEGVSTEALSASQALSRSPLTKGLNALGFEGSGHMLVKNAVDLTSQTLALTAIESATEALETRNMIYESFNGKVNPETGFVYTEDEKRRLAAAGASQVFKNNMTILAGPKFLEVAVFNRIGNAAKGIMNRATGQATTEAGKASGRVRSRLGNLSSGTSYMKASALSNVWKVGSAAAIGFVSEGLFEENIQLAISRTAQDVYGGADEFYRPGTTSKDLNRMSSKNDMFNPIKDRYIRQTKNFFLGMRDDRYVDDELSKSIGIGGAFGIGGGSVHSILGIRQQAKVDRYWNDRLNRTTTNLFESDNFFQTRMEDKPDPNNPGKTIPSQVVVTDPTTGQPVLDQNKLTAFLNKMNNIQGILDIVYNTEDPSDENSKLPQVQELNKLARNVLFTQLAMEYVRAGKKNLLLSNLTSSSQFSDKDIQALGYQPGMMSEEDKKLMLERMTNIVNRLDKANDWIDNNVLDNVSEKRQGKFGLIYTKTQKEKRRQEFEAKKAYLRGLAMQNVLLDAYLDDINDSESKIGTQRDILSSVLDENNVPITDFTVSLDAISRSYNSRVPALKNQLSILEKELAYHLDNFEEAQGELNIDLNQGNRPAESDRLDYLQAKVDEILEKINTLQSEYDELLAQRKQFLENDKAFMLVDEDGNPVNEDTDPNQNYFVAPRRTENNPTLEQLDIDKQRRINGVKREEIAIQKGWIEEEWKLTAALKEEKTKAEREDTLFSRRMSLSRNAYNIYFQREVMDRDNSLGQRKMRLYDKDEAKRITAKKYKANEAKLLKSVRIQGKVLTIVSDVNGQKLAAELNALLDQDLAGDEFYSELKRIFDTYNGKPITLRQEDKSLVDDQISETQDELDFVNSIFEYMPEDDRFNDKYYDVNSSGNYEVKPEYDDLSALGDVARNLTQRIDDLENIRKFLNSIPEEIPGDWNNVNVVKKRIADVYTETADSIIDAYNKVTNNGESEISGDSLSTQQDLDLIDQEIDELGQLKVIFEDRDKNDDILSTEEFNGFIPAIDERIELLKKIRDAVKERISSRLRENQDFLIDTVNSLVEQIGLNFDGSTRNEPIKSVIESVVGSDLYSKLVTSLQDLDNLIKKEDKDAEDKKNIDNSYWSINGQVSAIQESIKTRDKSRVLDEIKKQKGQQIKDIQGSELMKLLSDTSYYKDILNNIDDSLLGVLQLIFYQNLFTNVGLESKDNDFIDDKPTSPVYKFREDYNLRKFLRGIERDESRTLDNSNVTKESLLEFLNFAKEIQNLEELQNSLNSELNLLDQVEREKEIVQTKTEGKDNKYDGLIIPSIQQLNFIRKISSFLRRKTITGDNPGFRNWIFIQAPGGAGKTQTLGTWFNLISGIPKDRIMATAFTEEAARSIKKALQIEDDLDSVDSVISSLRELTKDNELDHDVLIVDEFPAMDVNKQKELFEAVSNYTKAKIKAGKGEFKVITMGDTNQLTFNKDGSIAPRPSIITNPNFFDNKSSKTNDNHASKIQIIPSLTVNFRSNIFAITSFIDIFKGSNNDNINANIKVTSTDSTLTTPDVKGVVSLDKSAFPTKIVEYIKANISSPRTRAIIVNDDKVEQYKKLLQANGITVIEDPNDELTKGVYVTSVKNSQGFSFDEVFVDLENKDNVLFTASVSPNLIYNKAMYVAGSRARNLIVVTNFPNFQNVEDDSINNLENKALDELRTKDDDFINQRDLEINGAKSVLGEEYNRNVTNPAPIAAEEKVETPLDQEEDNTQEEQEELEKEQEEDTIEEENNNPVPDQQEEQSQEDEDLNEGEDESRGNQVPAGDGLETNLDNPEIDSVEDTNGGKTMRKLQDELWKQVRDNSVSAYTKVRDSVIELLFPTAQTTKFKISDGIFSIKPGESFENLPLMPGHRVIVIPFQQSQNTRSSRKFGYAIVTPALDESGTEIENSYRTVAVLSDSEIDKFKESIHTSNVYDAIVENEKRNKGFVSIDYTADISQNNGFTTSSSKVINELYTGKVAHSQAVRYFYGKKDSPMNKSNIDALINQFIDNYYANWINSFPKEQRAIERSKIFKFYQNKENAQIIIPVNKDVQGKNPNLKIPSELQGFIRPGRPYFMFRPFHKRGSMQFIGLSRKFLNTNEHQNVLSPVQNFIRAAKAVKTLLNNKGINLSLGYSRRLSTALSKISYAYLRDQTLGEYKITIDNKEYIFTNTEAQKIFNMYSMYSEPSTQMIKAQTEKEIKNLINVRRARKYMFEDGDTIKGTIESYDPATKTFQVKNIETGEILTKSGVIQHASKSVVGLSQQTLDDIMNSNGNLASKFTSGRGKIGFITSREETGRSSGARNYKFMALLGSKTAPVVKSYNEDGTPKEYYDDVIEILEDLFTFAGKGELPGKNIEIYEDGQKQSVQMKFRVPVPLNARNEAGELEHDYSFSSQNTSRDTSVPNSKFFTTNFENLAPTRVFVEFDQEQQESSAQQDTEQTQVNREETSVVEETSREEDKPELNTLTKQEIRSLPFQEIRERLTREQEDALNKYAEKEGFGDIDGFFKEIYSNDPEEQNIFRDYILECLL